ncbi:tetratricopeptide repeat protein [Aquimarina sp. RZ0]|uniref:tetratricopeptide repeat protein n=1 Tax=Aquimarina sp. RZ0 TaxID=2607730 RepID=UPI0011F3C72F|nr:tetratricopeptide repeat protein [Aquimarina sp. RZ0]KAA1242832.1 tetratricopeptide repeat protein [Aquimarina sp. RZ0]
MSTFYYFLFIVILFFNSSRNYAQVNIEIDSLELALKKTEYTKDKISIYLELSTKYIDNNSRKAYEYAKEAYDLSVGLDHRETAYKSAIKLSNIHLNLSEFMPAISYAKKAENYALEQEDHKKVADAKITLANIHLALFDLEKSVELYYESLTLFEEIGNKKGISRALNGIGIVYHDQENYDKALEFFLNCHRVNKELGDDTVIAAILNNIASCYSGNKQHGKSIRYQKEAIEINKRYNNKFWESVGYYNLGSSYLSMGAREESIRYFKKSIKIAEEIEDFETIVDCKNSLAQYYFELKKLDSSISNALKAFSIADKYNLKHAQSEAAEILHKSYKQNKNFANAYKYAIIKSDLVDSLKVEKSVQKIANLELKYLIEKEEQKFRSELNRKKSEQIIIGIVGLFLLLTITTFLVMRHSYTVKKMKLEKNQVDNELKLRNKELALNVMTLLKKNDMLTSISKELNEVRSVVTNKNTKYTINKISKKIKRSSKTEIWKEFELRFKEVHVEFFKRLAQQFPDLTPGEQRLCALLRLNLSSKEIGELTGQSLSALEKARYRLRKKMNLSNSTVNLINYLSNL